MRNLTTELTLDITVEDNFKHVQFFKQISIFEYVFSKMTFKEYHAVQTAPIYQYMAYKF